MILLIAAIGFCVGLGYELLTEARVPSGPTIIVRCLDVDGGT